MSSQLIYLIAGARPNFMKIAPIVRALQKRPEAFQFRLIHTGQHYDQSMSDVFFQELEIPAPDYHLEVGGGSHAEQTAKIMVRFEEICLKDKPDVVLVVGDVNSTLACAIVAKKLHIRLAHVEAGLRSGDRAMPEEINRLVTDAITDEFFVTEKSGLTHLRREGHRDEQLHFVGHVMIDNLLYQIERLNRGEASAPLSSEMKQSLGDYAITTLHRPANVDTAESLQTLVGILNQVAERIKLIFPVHPRTRQNLDKFGLSLSDKIIQLEPLSYHEFLNFFRDARFVLTDSGGLQEETTALGVPCITLRDSTERPITVEEGSNLLAPLDEAVVLEEVGRILEGKGKSGRVPQFWDGKAAERILDVLSA
ncbi:UDP-N-acetylglucosamine 2-epimerase (non-hydrolyzing) [Granulosicoccaceae sp. 1_MG-2023]|nr:UDP-N-acetylglucosamine 2-epimerase (non-hydrolyzing) [Granulosicoccaceae sp. 1_MG-2023]